VTVSVVVDVSVIKTVAVEELVEVTTLVALTVEVNVIVLLPGTVLVRKSVLVIVPEDRVSVPEIVTYTVVVHGLAIELEVVVHASVMCDSSPIRRMIELK